MIADRSGREPRHRFGNHRQPRGMSLAARANVVYSSLIGRKNPLSSIC